MRAIIAIIPLAGLLSWLNPTPADSTGTWSAGLKRAADTTALARDDGSRQGPTLVGTIESALTSLSTETSARPANHTSLPTTTMLVDSAMVR